VPIVVPILFTLVIIVGFIGNLLVVLVVLVNRNMRNTTNILILNLAVGFLLPTVHV
jgi:allatostatin A receptor